MIIILNLVKGNLQMAEIVDIKSFFSQWSSPRLDGIKATLIIGHICWLCRNTLYGWEFNRASVLLSLCMQLQIWKRGF